MRNNGDLNSLIEWEDNVGTNDLGESLLNNNHLGREYEESPRENSSVRSPIWVAPFKVMMGRFWRNVRCTTWKETIVLTVSIASVVLNAMAIATAHNACVTIAASVGIFIAPITAVRQVRITLRDNLYDQCKDLKENLKELSSEKEEVTNKTKKLNASLKQ